jgi:hypothetical protein
MIKRKIEMTVIERERIVQIAGQELCSECRKNKAESIAAAEKTAFSDNVLFSFYYFKLLAKVLVFRRATEHPLNIKWRWNYWLLTRKRPETKIL